MATETHPQETTQHIAEAQHAEQQTGDRIARDPNYIPFDTEETLPLVEVKGAGLVRESEAADVSPSMIQEYPSQFTKKTPDSSPSPEPAPQNIPPSPEVTQEQERRRHEAARAAAELATREASTAA